MKNSYEEIKAMFHLIPRRLGWKAAEYVVAGARTYRGKRRYVAGYSHSRIYSHHMSGLCYDRILGYGDTQAAATKMMRDRLTSTAQPEAAKGEK